MTSFDHKERERIRAAVLAYARENRIGAPSLQLHIAKVTKRSVDHIPLKTLQRFLKDEGRTNDGFLVPLAEFVAVSGAAPPPDEGLARELGAFFARGELGERTAAELPTRFAGEYAIVAGRAKFSQWKVVKVGGEAVDPDHPYGRCVLSGGGQNLKVQEFETGPGSDGADGKFRPPANEGVALFFEPLIFMLLRSNLTRLPRVYWLREQEAGKLVGHAMHASPIEPGDIQVPYSELRNHELHPAEKSS